MSETPAPGVFTSTSTSQLDTPLPYKPLVIWPPEFTTSLENKENVRIAFNRTYQRIQKAGCHFLLLEPTDKPRGSILFTV